MAEDLFGARVNMSVSEQNNELATVNGDDRVAEFLEQYSTHYPRLQFYVTALLPKANDAADVLQEVSLVLWRKFESFELGTNFFAWASKIARFQVLKYREQQGRSARLFDNSLLEKLAADAADENVACQVPLQILENCLGKLSEEHRALIRRRYQPGMTVQRIAADHGRSANALSKSLSRIRHALLECIDRTMALEGRK